MHCGNNQRHPGETSEADKQSETALFIYY